MTQTQEKKPVEIGVPVEAPKKTENNTDRKGKDGEHKMSEEDAQIKDQVELLVKRSSDPNTELAKIAIDQLADLLRTSGSGSVASVPKPLKYVRTLYPELEQALKLSQDIALSHRLHDVLSFVAMTLEVENSRHISLDHKLKGTVDDLGQWGHEYLRFLAGGIADEWKEKTSAGAASANLSSFVDQITRYMVAHQDEPTAIDLLMEINQIPRLLALIDEGNYKRIADYVAATAKYLTRPDDTEVLQVVYDIYCKMNAYNEAVITAIKLSDYDKVNHLFVICKNKAVKLQMALTCARFKLFVDFDEINNTANEEEEVEVSQRSTGNNMSSGSNSSNSRINSNNGIKDAMVPPITNATNENHHHPHHHLNVVDDNNEEEEAEKKDEGTQVTGVVTGIAEDEEQVDFDEVLQNANGNLKLSELYRHAAKELDSLAPKSLEDIFKNTDTATQQSKDLHYNLSCAFASGFVNCGYGTDKYLTEDNTLLFDKREDRVVSTTAALGLLHLWDHEIGLQKIDPFFYSMSDYVKAGACLACGILMCGVKNVFDPAFDLLSDHVNAAQKDIAIGAILGIGYAYAGTRKEEVKELLVPILADGEQAFKVQCMAAFALANVFAGSADEDICETMMNCLLETPETSLKEVCVRYLILALGCMFLGCQETAETLLDATQALPQYIQRYTEVVVRACAFAATGNVVVVQNFFHAIAENDDENDEEAEKQEEGNNKNNEETQAQHASITHTADDANMDENEEIEASVTDSMSHQPEEEQTEPEEEQTLPEEATVTEVTTTTAAAATTSSNEGNAVINNAQTVSDHTKPKKVEMLNYKAAAVLGIGLVALGEELGEEMAKRAIIHALLADTVSKQSQHMSGRRAVPLVYALLSTSNPSMTVVETLNRLAHDSDMPTAMNAILAMGIVAAGSNNARVAGKLKSLASYHTKNRGAPASFVVRLAQGLCAMGKGHLTLSPLRQDRTVTCFSSLVGLLGLLHSALDLDKTILDDYHYMLFSLVPNILPRMVLAVDTNMQPLDTVQVRVGLAVDTVALPGRPKAITGFQTQTTPVLLSATDKVEVADAKYKPVSSIIEGVFVVIPKPNVDEAAAKLKNERYELVQEQLLQ